METKSFSVGTRGAAPIYIQATNWVSALGEGLTAMGRAAGLTRLACEVLPNGTVIVRDVGTGTGYVVQEATEPTEADGQPSSKTVRRLAALEPLLSEATNRIASAQLALDTVRALIPAESGSVLLEDRGYLRFAHVYGPYAHRLVGVRVPLGSGAAGVCMQRCETLNLSDGGASAPTASSAVVGTARELLCVPLFKGTQVFGVLELINLPSPRSFTDEEQDAVEKVASMLAVRIAQHLAAC